MHSPGHESSIASATSWISDARARPKFRINIDPDVCDQERLVACYREYGIQTFVGQPDLLRLNLLHAV